MRSLLLRLSILAPAVTLSISCLPPKGHSAASCGSLHRFRRLAGMPRSNGGAKNAKVWRTRQRDGVKRLEVLVRSCRGRSAAVARRDPRLKRFAHDCMERLRSQGAVLCGASSGSGEPWCHCAPGGSMRNRLRSRGADGMSAARCPMRIRNRCLSGWGNRRGGSRGKRAGKGFAALGWGELFAGVRGDTMDGRY